MAKIFISYRRMDTAASSGRIYDRLVARFGKKNVFKDVDDIPPGVDFADYIQDSLRQCAIQLAVIGPRWLDARDTRGERRLNDPGDFVRLEIETAWSLGLTVIPLLVDGAHIPASEDLPEPLQRLARINGLEVRNDPDFARDMERLINTLERALTARPSGIRLFGRTGASAPRAKAQSIAEPPTVEDARSPASTPVLPAPSPSTPTPEAVALAGQPHARGTAHEGSVPGSASAASTMMPRMASSAADQVTGKPRYAPVERGTRPSPIRARRPLLAALAVAIVVGLFAVLLSTNMLGKLGGSLAGSGTSGREGAATQTVHAYQTAHAQGTATAAVKTRFPYTAAAPGPGCDPAYATWQATQTYLVTCVQGHTHLTTCCITYTVSSGILLPQRYVVSVQISNLGTDSEALLRLDGYTGSWGGSSAPKSWQCALNVGYYLSGYDEYQAGVNGSANALNVGGPFTPTGTHTLAIGVNGATVTFALDGHTVGSTTLSQPLTATAISIGSLGANGATRQVDVSNFRMYAGTL